jgi:cytochrome c5
MKCNTWCCSNTTEGGQFIGEFCTPCYKAITTGIPTNGNTAWFEQLRNRLTKIENAMVNIQKITEEARGA